MRIIGPCAVLCITVGAQLLSFGTFGQVPKLEHRYVDANGVRLHIVTAGSGKLVIFLHGFPEFWYEWKTQLTEFGRDFQAVAPDMRGYNLSSKPTDVEQYQVKQLVEDVRALADNLRYKKFILVGHDWGGIVAWAFSLYHPEYLEKLIVLNAPHPAIFEREMRENPAQQAASQYMLLFRTPEAEKTLSDKNYEALVTAVLGDGLRSGQISVEDWSAYLEAWSQPGALTGGLNYYRAARIGPPDERSRMDAHANYTPDIASPIVNVPTLVVWGLNDPYLLTGNLSGITKYVPNVTVKLLPEASHWLVREQPQEVNAAIRGFISAN